MQGIRVRTLKSQCMSLNSVLNLTSCVTLGKLLHLSAPHSPNWTKSITMALVLW